MNVVAHEEKNEKTGKREVREERKQSIDFKEAVCCPSEDSTAKKWFV